MQKINWVQKLSSRKLWAAAAAFIAGLIVAFGGGADTAETVSGCIMSGGALIAYIVAEGWIDASAAGAAKEYVVMGESEIAHLDAMVDDRK